MRIACIRLILLCLVAFWTASSFADGACRFPVPDGDAVPTPPNLVGVIVSTGTAVVEVRTPVGRVRQVKPPKSGVFYSAFGGDEKVGNLRVGTTTKIWFENCRAVKVGAVAEAGYIEVYSNDPADKPPSTYLSRR